MGPLRITADADTKSVGKTLQLQQSQRKVPFLFEWAVSQANCNIFNDWGWISTVPQPRGTIRRIAATTCHCKQQHNTSKGGTLTQLHDALESVVFTRDLAIQEDQCKCTIKLLLDFFTQDELAVSNTEGNFGKQPLDKTKLPTLKSMYINQERGTYIERD